MPKGSCKLCGKPLSAGHIYQKGPYCDSCIDKAVEEHGYKAPGQKEV